MLCFAISIVQIIGVITAAKVARDNYPAMSYDISVTTCVL